MGRCSPGADLLALVVVAAAVLDVLGRHRAHLHRLRTTQLALITIAFPVLVAVRRTPVASVAVATIAVGIAAAGPWWFVDRLPMWT